MPLRSLLAPLVVPLLAASLALPSPVLAEEGRDDAREAPDATQARNLALGLAAVAAVALAVRAADRAEDEEERVLPAACLRPFRPRGERGAEDARPLLLHEPSCLDDRVERAGDLPLACAVTLRTPEGFEPGFDPDCLAEEGWQTD